MLSIQKILNDWATKHYTAIPFSLSQERMHGIGEEFLQFLTLPVELKKQIVTFQDPAYNNTDLGYYRREKGVGHPDNKEIFQFHPALYKYVSSDVLRDSVVKSFLSKADELFNAGVVAYKEGASALDVEYPGTLQRFFPPNQEPFMMVRFVSYQPSGDEELNASFHHDRSSLTLALAESSSGLMMGSTQEDVHPVSHDPNTVLFFPALLAHHTVGGFSTHQLQVDKSLRVQALKPTWHGVKQLPGQRIDPTTTRWAIVCFLNPPKILGATSEHSRSLIEY